MHPKYFRDDPEGNVVMLYCTRKKGPVLMITMSNLNKHLNYHKIVCSR